MPEVLRDSTPDEFDTEESLIAYLDYQLRFGIDRNLAQEIIIKCIVSGYEKALVKFLKSQEIFDSNLDTLIQYYLDRRIKIDTELFSAIAYQVNEFGTTLKKEHYEYLQENYFKITGGTLGHNSFERLFQLARRSSEPVATLKSYMDFSKGLYAQSQRGDQGFLAEMWLDAAKRFVEGRNYEKLSKDELKSLIEEDFYSDFQTGLGNSGYLSKLAAIKGLDLDIYKSLIDKEFNHALKKPSSSVVQGSPPISTSLQDNLK